MQTVLLSIHLIVALALVVTILLQRSEGGALGIGGGQGGMMTARGAGDLLTKTTKWLAIVFLANSLLLGWYAANKQSEADAVVEAAEEQPVEKPADQLPEIPTVPNGG
ncbi:MULTISPECIES: preprotein translocase subunit SecG [Kordiimonas]|uniref:preprotein translocase subunit SecG n=1 Tax=Kordiimonas TaxID=288021 RepID=UPI001FF0F443|nr:MULTISPECIES: preprotein translocase subunit SecG [Kordiimonas]MCK0071035.1 preprotein translocase subunit SecG [Kordiimonas laminariae]UTW57462.1 preprotein translocase subunit SecG [Kordiimonas sp. SCSIO 12603]